MRLDRFALSRTKLIVIFLTYSHGYRKWNQIGQSVLNFDHQSVRPFPKASLCIWNSMALFFF